MVFNFNVNETRILANAKPTSKVIKSQTPTRSKTRTPTKSVTRTSSATASLTPTVTATQTPTVTSSVTTTLTASVTHTPSITRTSSRTPSRTIPPTRTPLVLDGIRYDWETGDGVSSMHTPFDGDICYTEGYLIEFTDVIVQGYPIESGGCFTSGNYSLSTIRLWLQSRGKVFTTVILPNWVPTTTHTVTNTYTATLTHTNTPTLTPTLTPSLTPSRTLTPTITVIPGISFSWSWSGAKNIKVRSGMVCVGKFETQVSVIEGIDDMSSSITLEDGRCVLNSSVTALDLYNFLTRRGEVVDRFLTLP